MENNFVLKIDELMDIINPFKTSVWSTEILKAEIVMDYYKRGIYSEEIKIEDWMKMPIKKAMDYHAKRVSWFLLNQELIKDPITIEIKNQLEIYIPDGNHRIAASIMSEADLIVVNLIGKNIFHWEKWSNQYENIFQKGQLNIFSKPDFNS